MRRSRNSPIRLEILAEGFAARWSLEQINQKLEENGGARTLCRSFYEACLIYAFEHRMDYEEWKELLPREGKLFEKSKRDDRRVFQGRKDR